MIDTRQENTIDVAAAPAAEPRDAPARVTPQMGRPRVVVVGAGFGGLSAARTLAHGDMDVLVLDRNNYHGFWPLLYQVATAGLESESIAYPVRAILRKHRNASFAMVEARGVDFEQRLVLTDGAPIEYDYLVLAAGSANNYFGNDALAERTYGLKDLNDAEHLRNRILTSFERAAREPDPARRAALLTLVIVGGGPTGTELSGAFAELIRHVLRKDYPMLDVAQARVLLVEAGDRILASFPASLQRKALRRLERMGVEVRLNTAVASVDGETVVFKDGSQLVAGTVVWAAGVRAATLTDVLDVAQARGARAKVAPTLNLPDHPEVFVIGDMAYLEGYKGNQAYPQVAQVALQQGKQAARNILAQVQGRPMREFHYRDLGNFATIGRSAAILDTFGIHLSGFVAWVGWLFIHLMYLAGFRNRLVVLANWAYSYFTYDRGVRLITSDEDKNRG
jgi:NADH:quinone reductase (non-electrogenic)